MAILQAKRIQEALAKAQKVGIHEEPVTIAGCSIVISSLPPEAYEKINAEIDDLPEGPEYLNGYQLGHLSRSIVEIEGQDLRDIQFVEDDAPEGVYVLSGAIPTTDMTVTVDGTEIPLEALFQAMRDVGCSVTVIPPDETKTSTVKLERHAWVKERVLATWSREAVSVGWRKFSEVILAADEKAKEGIHFTITEETGEEKYRRLLGDMKDVAEELPDDMLEYILGEYGLQAKVTQEEVDKAGGTLAEVAPAEAPEPAPEPPPEAAPAEPVQAQETPTEANPEPAEPPKQVASPLATDRPDPRTLMANRRRLNQGPIQAPQPSQVPVEAAQPAQGKSKVPDQIRQAALTPDQLRTHPVANQPLPGNPSIAGGRPRSRAEEIAAMEGGSVEAEQQLPSRPEEVAELGGKTQKRDVSSIVSNADQRPAVGINPRFKPPR